MLVSRYYKFSCNSCRRQYATKLSPILLGTGRRRCKACGLVFHDGCKEWPQLTGSQKFQYFFPTTVLACSAAAFLVALVAVLIFRDQPALGLEMASVVFLVVMLPWMPYFLLQWRHISASESRFARRSALGDSEEFVLSA